MRVRGNNVSLTYQSRDFRTDGAAPLSGTAAGRAFYSPPGSDVGSTAPFTQVGSSSSPMPVT